MTASGYTRLTMILFWLGFLALVAIFLALDLGVFHRKAHAVSVREGLTWSVVWIVVSFAFSVFIYFAYGNHWLGLGVANPNVAAKLGDIHNGLDGHQAWLKYVTGYIVEWSLSVDNIFVIALIFAYFRIPAKYQHRVLFWGIIGAIFMRGGFILAGAAIIQRFHYILYAFGVFLIFTAIQMLRADGDPDPSQSKVLRQIYRRFNVTDTIHGKRFIVYEGEMSPQETSAIESHEAAKGERDVGTVSRRDRQMTGRRILTPLAVALVIVEVTDLVFAVDSIPAIFGITEDPFIVFTSNIFAILGLRSMYFALAGLLEKFHLLKAALAIILGLVGVKMLIGEWVEKSTSIDHNLFSVITLAVIIGLLAGGVILSLVFPKKPAVS